MGKKTIVILEDDKVFRETILETLNAQPELECIGAFSKIKELMKQLPDLYPDLFWLDISLPDGNSIDYIQEIKQIYPNTLCLICSMHDDDDKIFSALKAGADGYLLKDTKTHKIIEGIFELFNGGSPMSPFIARKVLQSMRTPDVSDSTLNNLTVREIEILSGLAQGFLYKEVADVNNISLETVKKHVQNIYRKLHVQTRSEAIIKYLKETNIK